MANFTKVCGYNSTSNATTHPFDVNTWDYVFHYCEIAILSLILMLNGVVILIFFLLKKPLQRNASNIFLFNQSIADCSVATPLIVYFLPHRLVWQHYYSLFTYTMFVSIGSILVNALDRFIAFKKPFHRYRFLTKRRVVIAVFSVWLVAIIPTIAVAIATFTITDPLSSWDAVLWDTIVAICSVILCFVLLILTLLFCTLAEIEGSLHQQSHKVKSETAVEECDIEHQSSGANNTPVELLIETKEEVCAVEHRTERRTVKILFSMVLVYAITLLPYVVTTVVYHTMYTSTELLYSTFYVSNGLTYFLYTLSAVINPLLTVFLKQDFNDVLRSYLRKGRGRPEVVTTLTLSEI